MLGLDRGEIARLLPYLTERERDEIERLATPRQIWEPLPGPQSQAYLSEADELFYGGAAGGGKSDLLLGLAGTRHRKSILFRREYPQLHDLIERSRDLYSRVARYNDNKHLWRFADGRQVEFGAVQYNKDVQDYQGRAHDLKAFDELPQFTEFQYRFLIGWNRTTVRGQRCRVVGAGNPPTTAEGEWVIRRFAPWLDSQHPNPARPGELRWFAVIDGDDREVEDGQPFEHKGEMITPKSRTFIPAGLADNPFLLQTGYLSVLQAMPEPLRRQMLYGDFNVGVEDDPWQVIPTAWVEAAMQRWRPDGRPPGPMTAVGVDVARGGKDKTVLAPRWGSWYGELEVHPGSSTPDGPTVSALVSKRLLDGGYANVDVIGVGASVYDDLIAARQDARGVNFAEAAPGMDRTGKLRFVNLRAYAYWSMREALDPVKGDNLALPPSRTLKADLCAPRWSMRTNGVQVEPKEDVAARLGRSPDEGDAVVLALLNTLPRPRSVLAQGKAKGW